MWGKKTPRAATFHLKRHIEKCGYCSWPSSRACPADLCPRGREIWESVVRAYRRFDGRGVDSQGRRNTARVFRALED
jgi:hypothetical protein